MASIVGGGGESPFAERRVAERRRIAYPPAYSPGYSPLARAGTDGLRVSWGGIWGGVLVAMGLLLLLSALGVAIGFSAAAPGESARLAAGAGIWAGVSLLLALFIGGMVATRIGAVFDRTTGFFEGALVWIMSLVIMVPLAGSGLGLLDSFSVELPDAPSAAWMGFAALLVSLAAAVLGAMAGLRWPGAVRR